MTSGRGRFGDEARWLAEDLVLDVVNDRDRRTLRRILSTLGEHS